MKIDARQIPPEGLSLTHDISPGELDLNIEIIKFNSPIRITARVWKITNAVSVDLDAAAAVQSICSRCLADFKKDFKKDIRLDYRIDNSAPIIDLNPDIRDELMLDYPIKPLCKPDCLGLCPKCGQNLNEGGCSCATT